jgi:hypothetical protein
MLTFKVFNCTYTYRPHVAAIIEGDVRQDYTLTVVEPDVEVPFLPIDSPAIQFERYTLGLSDVDWLEIVSQANGTLDRLRVIVRRWCCVERAAFLGDVDVDNLLCLDVVDRTEVERVSVLEVIDVRPVVHQSLLES